MRSLMIVALLGVSACSSGQYASYVGPLDPQLAPQVVRDMAAFVRARIKPTDGPIQLDRPADDQTIRPILASSLEDSGFTVTDGRAKHRVRYAAANLGTDVLLRVSVDRADAARLYRNKPGSGLSPLGPFSVTEIGE